MKEYRDKLHIQRLTLILCPLTAAPMAKTIFMRLHCQLSFRPQQGCLRRRPDPLTPPSTQLLKAKPSLSLVGQAASLQLLSSCRGGRHVPEVRLQALPINISPQRRQVLAHCQHETR